jgi:hypothetical protein
MPSWFDKFKSWFGGQPADEPETESVTEQQAQWVDPSETMFEVPVLNLVAITGGIISTTTDPAQAARAISWGNSVGDELDATPLQDLEEIACDLSYPAHPLLPDGLLFAPGCMEEKWVFAHQGGRFIVARSWTGDVEVTAKLERDGGRVLLRDLRLPKDSLLGLLGEPVQTLDWLIRTHCLGQLLPLPVGEDGARMLQESPLLAFSSFGNRAVCAACSWDPPPPPVPLRVTGRVMQAVRAGDHSEVLRLLEAGASPETPCPVEGLTPLCIAAIRGDIQMIDLLLSKGADPNLGEETGIVPLAHAIRQDHALSFIEHLHQAGTDTKVLTDMGFSLLHLAAEAGRADVIPWLLERGLELEARTEHGHTPLHLAGALGKLEAARALLAGGADREAKSPNGTAREIAEAEGHPEVAKQLGS